MIPDEFSPGVICALLRVCRVVRIKLNGVETVCFDDGELVGIDGEGAPAEAERRMLGNHAVKVTGVEDPHFKVEISRTVGGVCLHCGELRRELAQTIPKRFLLLLRIAQVLEHLG